MKHRLVMFAAAWLIAGVAMLADQKVQMKDLPAPVQKAVLEHTRAATVKGLSKEIEKGQTFYEAETIVNGHSRDLLFDAAGKLIEVEEEVSIDGVPAAVRSALEAHGKISRVESVTRGKTVTYEAQVEKNGKKTEVVVDVGGKRLKH